MRKVILQEILELSALELTANHHISKLAKITSSNYNSPPFRVTTTVMPHYRTFLHLDMTSCHPLNIKSTFRTTTIYVKGRDKKKNLLQYLNISSTSDIQPISKLFVRFVHPFNLPFSIDFSASSAVRQ